MRRDWPTCGYQLALEQALILDSWTCAWYDEAVGRGFIRPTYHPDAATVTRLHGYFHASLTPAEAVEACFGRKH